MAIDTQNKRRSVIQVPPLTIQPVPDGVVGGGNRAQITYIYGWLMPGAGEGKAFSRSRRRSKPYGRPF